MIRVRTRSFGRMLSMASGLLLISAQCAAQAQELRNLNNQFKSEPGCPIEVISAKTSLEMDSIGTPAACRIYIDYKNVSSKSVSGVKFRIGYIDSEEKVRGTFHAPDGSPLAPGGTASAKWRGERIDPRTASVMIRVLVAKYSDGTLWESEKLKGLAPGTAGEGQSVPSSGGPSSYAPPSGSGSAGSADPSASYGRPSSTYAGAGSGSAAASPASPAAKSAAGDSFDSFDGGGTSSPSGTSSPTGESAGEAASAASSSNANSATAPSSTTPANTGSSASPNPQSDKSTDGY